MAIFIITIIATFLIRRALKKAEAKSGIVYGKNESSYARVLITLSTIYLFISCFVLVVIIGVGSL